MGRVITDDERREVAEFLRRSVGKGASLLLLVAFAAFEVKSTDGERIVTADEAALRLADLIDPGEDRFSGAVKMIDREALLKLADEMGRVRSRCWYCNKEGECDWADETVCLESYMDDYARRIREALGVVDR